MSHQERLWALFVEMGLATEPGCSLVSNNQCITYDTPCHLIEFYFKPDGSFIGVFIQ